MATKKETKKPVKKAAKADKAPSKKTAAKPAKRKVAAKAVPKPAALDFPIVGIGASAGGLEALETFFSHMPETPGSAFVIIQHLSPKHKSIMGSLLGKYTKMPVLDIEDGMRIEAGHVYLNPPDKNVVLMGGHLQLLDPIRTGGINLPIDVFFRSMAEELREKAICMILSGTATDGTLGLKAVKGEGGMAMVQDPETAKYRGMPDSAAATGMVDFIHPAEELPEALVKYIKTPYVRAARQAAGREEETSNHLRKILAVIRSATGHDFSQYKENTIRRRVERRMAVHQIHEIKDYVRYVQQTPSEAGTLFKDMLIGVTRFFRDPEAFTALAQEGLPALLKARAPNSPLRAWVVGCATGEEAYSMAILLHEAVRALSRPMDIQIFASDIDADAVETARAGVYPVSIAADVSETRLEEFFVKEDNAYQVKKHIRERVVFAVQDVTKDPPFSRIDLLSMRNLLIYMKGDLQKRLLALVHYALNPKGLLFLGPSETIGEFTDHYEVIDNKWKLFRRREVAGKRPVQFPGAAPSPESGTDEPGPSKATREVLELHEVAERVILDQYAPAGVLVDGTHEIRHFMGKTDRYLETPVGKPSFQLFKMARKGIRAKLGPALSKALRQKKEVALEALQVPYNGHVRTVDVTVRPLTEAGVKGDFCLVLFEEKTPPSPAAPTKAKKGKTKRDPAKMQLEQELAETRENLQSTIEELETANEELKSANEEAQSVNEELQSTNEELETSKEELQSTNEELVTVNAELQNKVDDLSRANNDMNNLLAATEIATIFLDPQLRIKRFTPAATRIFNLIASDVDRPVSDITAKVPTDKIAADARAVLRDLVPKEEEIRTREGVWYSLKIGPYRTVDNVIDGVVITFADITETKRKGSRERLATVLDDANDAVLLQDFDGRIMAWNRGAERLYGYTEEAALEMNIRELIPEERAGEAAAAVKRLKAGELVAAFETQRVSKGGKTIDVRLTMTALSHETGKPAVIATTERDVTGRDC